MKQRCKKVLVIGSGPIVIGQAAEFDYAGVQCCRALKKEGIEVVLVNSNPATIMTDENVADKIYIEPIETPFIEKIIKKELPDSILAAFGGQTALNIAFELSNKGILDKYKIKILGNSLDSIKLSENRELFRKLMKKIKEPVILGKAAYNAEQALSIANKIGFPLIIRPSCTLGGFGSKFVNSKSELISAIQKGLESSVINQIMIEKSVAGYKEIEFEVVRDNNDNCIIVCSMENIDSMGIHTGDSIVVAPAQTLSQQQLDMLRQSAFKIAKALKINGGFNIQYALNPENNEYFVIEVNPRVSRSSALASKATGFPIAKVATKLAIGYNLTDFSDDISSLEPKPDYLVVKIPKFSFQKFDKVDKTLTTQMKSTGEIMAIGKTFEEAFYKGLLSTENVVPKNIGDDVHIVDNLRIYRILNALKNGKSVKKIAEKTKINEFFIRKLKNLQDDKDEVYYYKINSFCDKENKENSYFYSSKTKQDNILASPNKNKKVLIIGAGPIRIGQGIEFDYCCVHAINAVKKAGYEAILVNSNPETLSTDYDIATRLYFEPITSQYIKNIIAFEKPSGIIVQFGGQTSVNLINDLKQYNILGTSVNSINIAENRILFNNLLNKLQIPQPQKISPNKFVNYPAVVKPSFTIGGFGVQIVHNKKELDLVIRKAKKISAEILIDEYIEGIECEADIISDGRNILIAGFIENIEKSGIHSGDSRIVYPSKRITEEQKEIMKEYSHRICKELKIKGLLNIQFIIKNEKIYVIEVNPRASRTIPILQKLTGYPVCEKAIEVILGGKISKTKFIEEPDLCAVKIPVFSFDNLPNANKILTTEMKSTGEVLGIAKTEQMALLKAEIMSNKNFTCYNIEDLNVNTVKEYRNG